VPEDLDVHLVLDNLSTHKARVVKRWLAKRPRYLLHFTPTSSSWLNLVERFVAKLTQKQIWRGVHPSTLALIEAIESFIEIRDESLRPFVWIKTARRDPRFPGEMLSAEFRLSRLEIRRRARPDRRRRPTNVYIPYQSCLATPSRFRYLP